MFQSSLLVAYSRAILEILFAMPPSVLVRSVDIAFDNLTVVTMTHHKSAWGKHRDPPRQ